MRRISKLWLESSQALNVDAIIGRLKADLRIARAETQKYQQLFESQRLELIRLLDSEERASRLALHDEVTELPNRRHFLQRLVSSLHNAAHLAVFYIDLDDFKLLNDKHGHHVGDEVLKVIGQRLTTAHGDNFAASRFGGDEFACLLVGIPTFDHLAQIARRLLKAASVPLYVSVGRLDVRLSIGIARFPADGRSADELIQNADMAMYQAKRQHTGYAFCRAQSTKTALPADSK